MAINLDLEVRLELIGSVICPSKSSFIKKSVSNNNVAFATIVTFPEFLYAILNSNDI